jgi:hypothetical protein
MATYVNDLRLKEIGTGESSGTWGTETNTNLELIGEALGFGTEAITTNADTHTTTVADGSTDPGRAMYIKYTGTLDSACTITIAPNTMSRMHFIENGTSGSQNIIISQGTGANVTIPAGDVKAVYLDGAGSGAAVADAFASLNVVDLKVEDDLTITDDLTFSSDSAVVTFGADGDTTLTHTDGTGLTLNSTNKLCFNDASQFIQGSSATVLSLGATDEIDLTATAIDVNGTMDVSGSITSSAEMTLTRSDNGINLTLVSTDADANEGPGFVLYRNSSSPADGDVLGQIYFQGENDADQKVSFAYQEARIVDASDGTEDGRIETNVVLAGTAVSRVLMDATETVFNDNSKDLDFRVESDNVANMLFVNGGTDVVTIGGNLGLGVDAPQALIHTHIASSGAAYHQFTNSATGSGSGDGWRIGIDGDENFVITGQESTETFLINNNSANRFSVNHNGIVAVGTSLGTDAVLNVVRSSGEVFRADANNGAFRLVADQDQVMASVMRVTAGALSAPSYSFVGDTSTGISRPTGSSINFVTGGSENARFLDGSLLIGSETLDANSQKFQVFQNANNKFTGIFICDGNNVNRFGPAIRAGTDDNSGTNTMLTFQDGDGDGIGTITSSGGTVTYGAFTAHHEVNVPDADNPSDDSDAYPYGTLVEIVSVYLTEANKRQSIRYTVQKSQSANSKKVLGAYSSNMRPSPMCPTTGTYANNLHNISILGDGHIICNNSGGNIEVGDGICTSSTAGIGMKATDNPSMIVGIAQEAVTFSGSETKLVPVQFGVQQFTPWS